MPYYYAVKTGRVPGVYKDWSSCKQQVDKFPKARFKKFESEAEAWIFVGGKETGSNGANNDEQFSSYPDDHYESDSFDPYVISTSDDDEQECQAAATSSKCRTKSADQSATSEVVDMLRATATMLRSTAQQLNKIGDKAKLWATTQQVIKGMDTLNTQIDQLADSLHSGGRGSTTASFSAEGSVRDNLKRSYSDFTPLGGTGGSSLHSKGQRYATASSSTGGSAQDNLKRSHSDFTSVGGARGSHDGSSKNDAAKKYKKMKLDPSGSTDCGFTGVPFPDNEGTVVYTDGSSTDNGYATAKAGIGVYWGPHDPYNKSERLSGRQTNNRAEIHAAEVAVQQAKQRGIKNLILYTDSQFLISGITAWIKKWKKNGWKLSTGGDVINREDFEKLDMAISGINIKWMHVRGHRGIEGNEAADRLANAGTKKPLT